MCYRVRPEDFAKLVVDAKSKQNGLLLYEDNLIFFYKTLKFK